MVDTHKGDSMQNARIKIDYSGKKPKVDFSYPDKKNQFNNENNAWFLPFMITTLFIFVPFMVFFGFTDIKMMYDVHYGNPTTVGLYNQCSTDFDNNYYLAKHNLCVRYALNDSVTYNLWKLTSVGNYDRVKTEKDWLETYLWLLLFFLPPSLLYYADRNFWRNLYPKWMAQLGARYIVKFRPEHVNSENIIKIPLFRNVYLDYKATKDFSKYLKEFEIKEHPFQEIVRKKAKKGKKKTKVNEWLWSAKFYFTKKPQKGELLVEFQ